MGHIAYLSNNSPNKINFIESYTKYKHIDPLQKDFQIFIFPCKTWKSFEKNLIFLCYSALQYGPKLINPEDNGFDKFESALSWDDCT